MHIPAFSKDGNRAGIRCQQGLHVFILLNWDIAPPGGTEGDELCAFEFKLFYTGKKFQILGVGAGIPGFDVINPQFIQAFDNV